MTAEKPWWETTEFDFIRIPKEIFRNPYYSSLSPESKLLYGFLLDRASLSRQNGEKWKTPEGDPFVIFTLAEIQQRLHCAKPKAIALLKALEAHQLIQRDRPQKDGPYHIVVKPFCQRVIENDLPRFKNITCPSNDNLPAQVTESDLNNTDKNNTEINHTDSTRQQVEYEIKKNIYYDILSMDLPKDKLDAIVEVMTDTLCTCANTIWIGGAPREKEAVCKRLLEADDMRIRYLFDHMKQNLHPIGSYRAYYLARLWEPDGIVDAFYENWVRRDMRAADSRPYKF